MRKSHNWPWKKLSRERSKIKFGHRSENLIHHAHVPFLKIQTKIISCIYKKNTKNEFITLKNSNLILKERSKVKSRRKKRLFLSHELWELHMTSVGLWLYKFHVFILGLYCVPNNPCFNGATCSEAPGSALNYMCTCPMGFTGTRCETSKSVSRSC